MTEAQGKVAAEHGGGHGPLSQFEVTPIIPIHIGNLDLSFTNSALWMGDRKSVV